MSTYIDSIILFVLCALLVPIAQLDAFFISCILILFALYCFEIAFKDNKALTWLGVVTFIFCLFVPEVAVFLPLMSYIFFYKQQFVIPSLYCLPIIMYLYANQHYVNFAILLMMILSYYLAHNNAIRNHLQETIHSFRDSSVEQEMILKQANQQLLENQNDQIYIATLKERNRIAREIHDNVGHMLSRSILQVGAMIAVCKDETLKPHLTTLKDTLDTAMNSIRSSVHDLHDESVDLKHALENLVENFSFCAVQLKCEASKHLPKDVKYCFLAITKEALNNTIKHSNATKVTITIKEHPGFYQLLVEDNGTKKSSKNAEVDSTGIGLSNMRERVDALHGIIHINQENGFRIFVSVQK